MSSIDNLKNTVNAGITPLGADDDSVDPLRIRFAEFLAAYQQRLERERGEVTSDSSGQDSNSDEGDAQGLPADDEFPDYMEWMQDYLEFILLQRDCSARCARLGLPPAPCTRHAPCNQCRLHDGSYVPAIHWHVMSDAELERHLVEYMRIRDNLPPWQSTRPEYTNGPPSSVAAWSCGHSPRIQLASRHSHFAPGDLNDLRSAIEEVASSSLSSLGPSAFVGTSGNAAGEDDMPALEIPPEATFPPDSEIARWMSARRMNAREVLRRWPELLGD